MKRGGGDQQQEAQGRCGTRRVNFPKTMHEQKKIWP